MPDHRGRIVGGPAHAECIEVEHSHNLIADGHQLGLVEVAVDGPIGLQRFHSDLRDQLSDKWGLFGKQSREQFAKPGHPIDR